MVGAEVEGDNAVTSLFAATENAEGPARAMAADGAQGQAPLDSLATLAVEVAYRGAPFAGFARQPGLVTVQGELEHGLGLVFRRPVQTTCAGRTDAGVHARGQVVSFDVTIDECQGLDFRRFLRSLNALTHDAMVVRKAWRAADGFSARFDAVAREYRYFLCVDQVPPVFSADFSWHCGPVDVCAMEQASRCLLGEHDFKSFCKAVSAVGKPTCRNVMEVDFESFERCGEQMLAVRVVGSSFLHSMVRTLVGTLVMVGKGKRPPEWVRQVLEARDRTAAGECAPAQGLVLWGVRYG